MKRFLTDGVSMSGKKGGPKPPPKQGKGEQFPNTNACLMIFSGPTAQEGKKQQKIFAREVNAVEPAVPSMVNRRDHPTAVPHPGRIPLVV
jgi:hypothetical protein